MHPKRVLTTGEIARYCAVHFRTVLRWIERGELRAYKLPGRGDNRVKLEDFLDFLSVHEMPVPEGVRQHTNRVLVVEDEPRMARSIRRVLERAGFEVATANDGFRAGTYLTTFCPAVVTLDLQMPGLTGMDVLAFIRETPGQERVKILVVSGLDDESLQEAIDAGADEALAKPFENDDLVRKVQALTESRHALPAVKNITSLSP
ncbi:MAG: response regulator [Pirellulaceae bacterium]|nr:response regulator [Planctomycetales bacterium]